MIRIEEVQVPSVVWRWIAFDPSGYRVPIEASTAAEAEAKLRAWAQGAHAHAGLPYVVPYCLTIEGQLLRRVLVVIEGGEE